MAPTPEVPVINPKTILVVDDHEDSRMIYSTILQHYGYITISARDGAASQPLPWVEGLTFRHGSILLTFRRTKDGGGPATELRYDTGTEHSILARS